MLTCRSGTCLWLWLGVLDAIQGVGLGMILLQTLSRLHVCATLAGAQLLGSSIVMLARFVFSMRINLMLMDLQGDRARQGRTRKCLPRPCDLEHGDWGKQPFRSLGVLALFGVPNHNRDRLLRALKRLSARSKQLIRTSATDLLPKRAVEQTITGMDGGGVCEA